jgi:hypothetical protein
VRLGVRAGGVPTYGRLRKDHHGFIVQRTPQPHIDTMTLLSIEFDTAEAKAKELATRTMFRVHSTYDQSVYQSLIQDIWIQAKRRAGVPISLAIRQIASLETAKQLNKVLVQMHLQEQ